MEKHFAIPFDLTSEEACQLRIAVAKDVLLQLKNNKIRPVKGTYCTPLQLKLETVTFQDIPAHKVFKESQCKVCAIGSILVSMVSLCNEVSCKELQDEDSHQPFTNFNWYLEKVFTKDQLRLMEAAFEERDIVGLEDESFVDSFYTLYKKYPEQWMGENGCAVLPNAPIGMKEALCFNLYHTTSTETLLKIMNNIIDNNGEFKP